MFYIYKNSNYKTYQEKVLFCVFFSNIIEADEAFLSAFNLKKFPNDVSVEIKKEFQLDHFGEPDTTMLVVKLSKVFPKTY